MGEGRGRNGDPFVKTDFVLPSNFHFVFLSLVHSGVLLLLEKKSQKDIERREETGSTKHETQKSSMRKKLLC
jgi:hypothetical protein